MDQKGPTHAPFSERMSSNPTKLEDAMGACAIAALGTSVAKRRLPGKQPVIRRSPSRSTRFHVASLPLGGCLATRLPDLEGDARLERSHHWSLTPHPGPSPELRVRPSL